MVNASPPLLDIRNVYVTFHMEDTSIDICSDVSLSIGFNERVGLIGESGCGKTLVALAILRLLPENSYTRGEILFQGVNLVSCSENAIQSIRGHHISMIFEQPRTCLNPVFSIGSQIREAVLHSDPSSPDSKDRARELLTSVGMDPARYHEFPHQMSGGMQQRVMIAMAMASSPLLLIADEPTTALDLIHQAQILDLIKMKVADTGCSLFIITHDLDVAAELCDRVMVMYAGEIVETIDIQSFIACPRHPYSQALLSAVTENALSPIPGTVPEFYDIPPGCRFHPRCTRVKPVCRSVHPPLKITDYGSVRCHFA